MMARLRHGLLAACLLVACDREHPQPSAPQFVPASDPQTPDSPSYPDPASFDGGGGLPLVIEADTPCKLRGGATQVVFPADAKSSGFTRLAKAGTQRIAEARYDQGFVVFDQSDASGLFALGDVNRIAPSDTEVAVVALSGPTDVIHGRFDLVGKPIGTPVTLGSDHPSDVAIGRSGTNTLAVWSTLYDVKARGVDAMGALAGAAFWLEKDSAKDSFHASIIDDGNGSFAIHWTDRRVSDGQFSSYFTVASTVGISGLAHKIFRTSEPHAAVALVKTDAGYAALIDHGKPSVPVIVPLDRAGRLAGPGHALAGATTALGMAVRSNELGVVAVRQDLSIGFRPFDSSGKPIGPWVCLDAPSDVDLGAAIDTDGEGWAVLYSAPDGAQSLARLDRLGTGVP
ncbi:MAG: hypothetical protein ACXVEF_14640 [Polyangiales bacterium]